MQVGVRACVRGSGERVAQRPGIVQGAPAAKVEIPLPLHGTLAHGCVCESEALSSRGDFEARQ